MNHFPETLRLLLIGLFIVLFPSCKPPTTPPVTSQNEAPSNVVAMVGDRSITLETLQEEVDKAQGAVPLEKILERLIRHEALLYRAQQEGISEDPQVQKRIETLLIGELKRRNLTPRLKDLEISKEEIEIAYREHSELFHEPEMRRLAIIYALNSEGQALERVSSAISQSNKIPADQGFSQLALKASNDKRSRYRGGDIGWVRRDQYPSNAPETLIEKGFSLAAPGDVAEATQLEDGWGTVRLIAIRPENIRPMDELAVKQLISLLTKEKRQNEISKFETDSISISAVEIWQPNWASRIKVQNQSDKQSEPPLLPGAKE